MSSELANCEANYTFCLGLFKEVPSEDKQKKLARKQILIDQYRKDLALSTRWYTWKEIRDFEKDEDSMDAVDTLREPIDIPENDDNTVWAEKTKYYREEDDREVLVTLTLDAFIEKLQAIREKVGGDVPVFRMEHGAYNEPVVKVSEHYGAVAIW